MVFVTGSDLLAVALYEDLLLGRARREATADGDRVQDRHIGHVGITSRGLDLTDDEERPVFHHIDGDAGIADEALAKALLDEVFSLLDGLAADVNWLDEWHRDRPIGTDDEFTRQVGLAEDGDAQLVTLDPR